MDTGTASRSYSYKKVLLNILPVISIGMVEVVEWEMLSGSPISILSSPTCSGDWKEDESYTIDVHMNLFDQVQQYRFHNLILLYLGQNTGTL
jgi:hypothetical protein